MIEKDIITEIERYLSDTSYNYAVMIDGDWGCGKTYFVKHGLTDAIHEHEKGSEKPRKPLYISLYGHKSILDIQDAIAIHLHASGKNSNKSFWGKIGKSKNVEHSLQSVLALAKAARDIFAPGASIFEFENIWRDLKNYIFIFDDVERCDCPLNEVFGFVNGLVEHSGVKVILVANEKEIQLKELLESKELQYLVALNEQIEYPKVKDILGEEVKNNPLSAEELERRRKILFPTGTVDEDFKKIQEKLIGVTLHFQPDAKAVCSGMIDNSSLADRVKEKLHSNLESFYSTMRNASHLNLRTFQFFLSKLNSVMDSLAKLTIPSECIEEVENKIILDCFSSAVDFKANIQPPADGIERMTYDLSREKRSIAVEQYVETGELPLALLQEEIDRFVEENVIDLIPADDPFKLLKQEYYLHSQRWCEEQIMMILDKLDHNAYPTIAYGEIIRSLLYLEGLGFDKRYLNNAKDQMIANIAITDHPKVTDNHLLLVLKDNPNVFNRAKQVLAEIENAVAERNKTEKVLSIEEILKQETWVEGLTTFAERNDLEHDPNVEVFSSVESSRWITLLNEASPKTLYEFRCWFTYYYPTFAIRQGKTRDLDVLKEIFKGIAPNQSDDLIKKNLLRWLKSDIEKIYDLYGR